MDRVAELAAAVVPFPITFATTAWFGEQVLWVKPEPSRPVEDLIVAVLDGWPDCPLYGEPAWTKNDIVAHVTVGYGQRDTLADAEQHVLTGLPVEATIDEMWLMEGVPGQAWRVRQRFAFTS